MSQSKRSYSQWRKGKRRSLARPSRWSLSPVVPWEEDLDELIRLYGYGRRRKAEEEDSGSSSGSSSEEEYYNDSDSARLDLSCAALLARAIV